MSTRVLEQLVGTAVIDQRFRESLLNGQRREVIADFELTAEERTVILGIQAQTLQEFAGALDRWIQERDRIEICPTLVPMRLQPA